MLRHTMCPQSEHVLSSPEPAGIIRLDRKVGMHTLRKGAAMSLQLFELVPTTPSREAAEALIAQVSQAVEAAGASVLESQVTASHERIFTIVELGSDDVAALTEAVRSAAADAEVTGPDEVRLVGAELEDVRALARKADYLVEWDIPEEISMETYLARKKANSPKYAQVPEVSFLRTYVREDTVKCLCFYDAPDEEAVVRAREAVSTPIDRLHALEG